MSAGQPLGEVRSAPRWCTCLPAGGVDRAEALDSLRAVIAADVVQVIEAAVGARWHPLDHEQIVDGYVTWWRGFILGAIFDGVEAWRQAQ